MEYARAHVCFEDERHEFNRCEIELGGWFLERAERAHDKNKQEWNHLKAGIDAYDGENRKYQKSQEERKYDCSLRQK